MSKTAAAPSLTSVLARVTPAGWAAGRGAALELDVLSATGVVSSRDGAEARAIALAVVFQLAVYTVVASLRSARLRGYARLSFAAREWAGCGEVATMTSETGTVGDEELRQILTRARRIAVVGLSPRPERPSYQVAEYLQRQGYEITPVNPVQAGRAILGRTVLASLTELSEPPDIIDIFRRSMYVPDVVADAERARDQLTRSGGVALDVPSWVIWTQLGVVNPEATQRARERGFIVVEDRCLRVEHSRLGIGRVH